MEGVHWNLGSIAGHSEAQVTCSQKCCECDNVRVMEKHMMKTEIFLNQKGAVKVCGMNE